MLCRGCKREYLRGREVSERDLRYLFVVHVRAAEKLKRRCLLEPWHILKHTTSPQPLRLVPSLSFKSADSRFSACIGRDPNMQRAMYLWGRFQRDLCGHTSSPSASCQIPIFAGIHSGSALAFLNIHKYTAVEFAVQTHKYNIQIHKYT